MRQLKGKVKENKKQKKERREDFVKQRDRVFTVVLPTLAVIAALIVAYVFLHSRPKTISSWGIEDTAVDVQFGSDHLSNDSAIQL